MVKSDGNGGMKFDKVSLVNTLVIVLPILATLVIFHLTTLASLRDTDAKMAQTIAVNSQRLTTIEDDIKGVKHDVARLKEDDAAIRTLHSKELNP
jgi:hypothetical protein